MNKRLISCLILSFFCILSFVNKCIAQKQDSLKMVKTDTIKSVKGTEKNFSTYDEVPIPPEGEAGYRKFLSEHIRYPMAAYNANASGTVYISITVDKDGTLTNVHIQKDTVHYGCGEEAVRVIKMMPPWKPGKMNGEPVKVRYTIPVKFSLHNAANDSTATKKNPIYEYFEEPPLPDGGWECFKSYLARQLTFPAKASGSNAIRTEYLLVTIKSDGRIRAPQFLHDSIGHGFGHQLVRALRKCPDWRPYRSNGRTYVSQYWIYVRFDGQGRIVRAGVANQIFTALEEDYKTNQYFQDIWFPNGMEGYEIYMSSHIQYPEEAIKEKAEGTEYVTVVIGKDGKVVSASLKWDNIGYGCGEEAVRVVKAMPAWKPRYFNGRIIKNYCVLPVRFKLPSR